MKKKLIGIFVCMLLIGTVLPVAGAKFIERTIVPVPLDGNILYVGGSGIGNYSTIQDAIDNASDGDTVFVYDDSSPYNESIDVNKSIKLIGENRETTIIEGSIYVLTDWVNISEFTIQRGLYIIYCDNINITGNHITDDEPFFSVGIWLITTSNIIIRSNTIHDNRFGLFVLQCKDSIIEKNNFFDNTIHVYFSFIFRNFWDSNYWDRFTGNGPKIIFGSFGFIWIPWINLDRNPAQEPYDI